MIGASTSAGPGLIICFLPIGGGCKNQALGSGAAGAPAAARAAHECRRAVLYYQSRNSAFPDPGPRPVSCLREPHNITLPRKTFSGSTNVDST